MKRTMKLNEFKPSDVFWNILFFVVLMFLAFIEIKIFVITFLVLSAVGFADIMSSRKTQPWAWITLGGLVVLIIYYATEFCDFLHNSLILRFNNWLDNKFQKKK